METEKKQDGYRNEEYSNSSDDRWLRMRVRDRYRWSAFDDYDWNDYRYNSWAMGASTYNPFTGITGTIILAITTVGIVIGTRIALGS
ncbi:hypothetical protein [Paraflavitalea speifideaquila]|uniref:hypothetical protein n=1 Tax=Paraflavitalea speifideaquila TaxID=3076558 RepID=UPI0028E78D43|nr:hypothetical protein [Paraflavitalea speifideiaquila]